MSIVKSVLEKAKHIVFENGNLIYWLNIPAFRRSQRKVDARPRKEKVRIGFILQSPTNWAVVESVYLAAREDPQVEPVVLMIPELEFLFYVKLKKVIWEETWHFAETHIDEPCIPTWDPATGTWLRPEDLDLDYVIYERPYETYLPKCWRASSVRKFSRPCFIPYATTMLDDYFLTYNMHFIRNLSLAFCENRPSCEYVSRRLKPTIQSRDQRVFLSGCPKYDLNRDLEGTESPVWPRKRSEDIFRIIWTPRWTADPRLGGTSFFDYAEDMLAWAESDPGIDLVFRPHPLALKNYVNQGLITQEALDDWLNRCRLCENVSVDLESTYYHTFWSSDLLITDISTMFLDYLFCGRPILYCPTRADKAMTDDPRYAVYSMLDSAYIVRNMKEIRNSVAELRAGKDPKKESRQRLAVELRQDGHIGKDIVDLIKTDYYDREKLFTASVTC